MDASKSSSPGITPSPTASGRAERREHLFGVARSTSGFMPDDEGEALYLAALRAGASFQHATLVEIGAWCGKSTVYIGAAVEETGGVLFSLDHHHGSEENQPGWEHQDTSLVDSETGLVDTLPHWRRTMITAGLESSVVGIVGDAPTVSVHWSSRWPSASSTEAMATSRPGPTTGGGRRRWQRTDGWPSTTSSPIQPTGDGPPTTSGGPH